MVDDNKIKIELNKLLADDSLGLWTDVGTVVYRGRVLLLGGVETADAKARAGAAALGLRNTEFREGVAEELPVASGTADVVISNGVINLCPDKMAVLGEIARVLKPGGRVQIADIVVHRPVPQEAKDDIDLWSG